MSFQDDLAWSNKQSREWWWDHCYQQWWDSCMTFLVNDRGSQRRGIDRVVRVCCAAGTLTVDEKVRNPKSHYTDIALEHVSVSRLGHTDKPGWVCDTEKTVDFIAYALPRWRCAYLLPLPELREAWKTRGESWMQTYGERQTYEHRNDGYVTKFVPVPPHDIAESGVNVRQATWAARTPRNA